jgi:hypothetical protein
MKDKVFIKIFGKSASFISMIKHGKRQFTFDMAKKMEKMFPFKSKHDWKISTFEEWKQTIEDNANGRINSKKLRIVHQPTICTPPEPPGNLSLIELKQDHKGGDGK